MGVLIITMGNCLTAALREAGLAIRSTRITAFIQPQYSHTGEVTGAELLARWRHPLLGVVSPAEFIPLARDMAELGALGIRFSMGDFGTEARPMPIEQWLRTGFSADQNASDVIEL